MQNILSFAVAVSLTVWTAVAPRGAAAAPAQATAASDISPVVSIHGTIVGVNERARLVTVRDDGGQVLTVSWTEFTRLAGDPIKVGDIVWLDMTERGGREVATSMTIQAAKPY
jgi:ribosomal protein S28E/S33